MGFGRVLEKIMGMDERAWQRHANPWSGWTRLSILPLFALAVWSREWIGWNALWPIALVLLWTWLNPRLFAPPASTDNWMSKGVLGEQLWLNREHKPVAKHHLKMIAVLSVVSLLGLIPYVAGLILLHPWLTLLGILMTAGGKLWMMDRMVWLYQDHQNAPIN